MVKYKKTNLYIAWKWPKTLWWWWVVVEIYFSVQL